MAENKNINAQLTIKANSTNSISFADDGAFTVLNADAVLRVNQRIEVWGGGSGKQYLDVRDQSGNVKIMLNAEDNSYFAVNNVGIGTTSPGAKLEVNGDGTNTGGIALREGTNQVHYIYTDGPYQYNLIGSSSPNWRWGQQGGDVKMALNNNGLGIGTTSPDAPLTVHSSTDPEIRFGYSSSQDHRIVWDSSKVYIHADPENANASSAIGLGVDGTIGLLMDNEHDVGIGTTSPNTRLHVADSTTGVIMRIQNSSAGEESSLRFQALSSTSTQEYADIALDPQAGSGALVFRNPYTSERMRIDGSGNVGIGTTSPSTSLHVVKDASWEVARFEADSYPTATVYSQAAAKYAQLNIYDTRINSEPTMELRADTPHFNIRLDDTGNVLTILDGGNVGIGTTSPSYKLDVAGDIYISNGESLYLGNANSRISSNSSSDILYFPNNDHIFGSVISGADVERMRITEAGNVGIGTTSPDEKFVVSDGANINFKVGQLSHQTVANPGVGFTFSRTSSDAPLMAMGVLEDDDLGVMSRNTIQFLTGGTNNYQYTTERMRIHADGNVSVGTTNAYARFSVKATSHNNGISVNRQADNTAAIYIGNDGGNNPILAANNADMLFGRDLSGTFTERMRLTNDGNLGIGTTSPQAALHINNYNLPQLLLDGGDDSTGDIVVPNGEILQIGHWNTGTSTYTDRFRIIANGNVGIGTTSPGAKLDVAGSIGVTSGDTFGYDNSGAAIYMNTAGVGLSGKFATNGYSRNLIRSDGSATIQIGDNTSLISLIKVQAGSSGVDGVVSFLTKNSERMRVHHDGNVGIGTTSPSYKLDVSGDAGIGGTLYSNDIEVDGGNQIVVNNSASAGHITIGGIQNEAENGYMRGNVRFSRDDDQITYDNVNNVFVHAGGSSTDWSMIAHHSDGMRIYSGASDSSGWSKSYTDFKTDYMSIYINNSGNVGIGTDSPSQKLHVEGGNILVGTDSGDPFNASALVGIQGTTAAYFQAKTNTSGTAGLLLGDTDDDYHAGLIYNNSTSAFTFNAGNSTRLTIDGTSGNVGIGTTSPTYKLDVNGGIRTSSVTGPGILDLVAPTSFLRFQANANNIFYDAGGNHYFRTASGASTSMIVTSAGNVGIGIGTTSPSSKLHVQIPTSNNGSRQEIQRWVNTGQNSVSLFAYGGSIDLIQIGAWNSEQNIAIVTEALTSMSATTAKGIYIKSGGNVGIGTTSPSHKLDVNGDIAVKGASIINKASAALVIGDIAGTDSVTNLTLTTAGRNTEVFLDDAGNVGINDTTPSYALDVTGTIRATGDVIAYSDARVKENVETIPNALDRVKAMRGVGYNKIGSEERSIGVIAQEMLDVMPEVVHTDDQGMHSVAYGNLVGVLIEAMKEQQQQIDELKAIIANR